MYLGMLDLSPEDCHSCFRLAFMTYTVISAVLAASSSPYEISEESSA
ncbi:hypothetical protein CAter282_4297 [Collimonas arenae]|uniref:Uncharacterized protein n=2 Tax=Collimonas TaxID=202907 RepID=A0A127QPQ5_9BURK|nr:hypothetical protein CAter282_4297 [Collimonas arenae]AMP17211.1 hypothetical protein CPter291_4998 [Collimonas pratensis]